MTSGLRRAHKYIWLVLALIIPVLMFFSIKDLNIFSSETKSISTFETSKMKALKIAENDLLKVSLYSNNIEIILKSSLKNSTSIVYEMGMKGEKKQIIGQLTAAGIYNFNVTALPKGILIYDALKKEIITKLQF